MTVQTYPVWGTTPAPQRLTVDGRPSVDAWVARTREERNTGLLGTTGLEGALWIERCANVHTFAMAYPIDVVFVSRAGRVTAVRTMRPRRASRPRFAPRATVELAAGVAATLGIRSGVLLGLVAA